MAASPSALGQPGDAGRGVRRAGRLVDGVDAETVGPLRDHEVALALEGRGLGEQRAATDGMEGTDAVLADLEPLADGDDAEDGGRWSCPSSRSLSSWT